MRVSLGAGLHVSLAPGAPSIAPPGAGPASVCGAGVISIPVFGRNLPRSWWGRTGAQRAHTHSLVLQLLFLHTDKPSNAIQWPFLERFMIQSLPAVTNQKAPMYSLGFLFAKMSKIQFSFEMDVSLSELRESVMDREAWSALIHGVTKNRTRLSD